MESAFFVNKENMMSISLGKSCIKHSCLGWEMGICVMEIRDKKIKRCIIDGLLITEVETLNFEIGMLPSCRQSLSNRKVS